MSVRQELLEAIFIPEVFDRRDPDLPAKQLAAAQELFSIRKDQIPLVRRRADEAGITEIRRREDIVPLLFAHTAYKSYPQSFIEQGRWDRMCQWLKTLSVEDTKNVDVSGVKDVDDWIEALHAAGHMVLSTSGTSGKCSFLNHTRGDGIAVRKHHSIIVGWPRARGASDRTAFFLGPSKGPSRIIEAAHHNAYNWGKPGSIHFLSDEPLRMTDISAMAALRARMAEGKATPSEIEAFERSNAEKRTRMAEALETFTEKILAHRHEPIFISGQWAQHLMIKERAHRLGIKDGDFNPKSVVSAGGGIKGVALPPDYKEQVDRFYGDVIRIGAYGMTEQAQTLPRCEHMRYHRPPGLIWLLLDEAGESLLNPPNDIGGQIEGRYAFLDLLYEGRWGGLISGDKVTIDFAPECPCGRPGPTVLDTITRYSQSGADHIGCAGTIDSYIRGSLSA